MKGFEPFDGGRGPHRHLPSSETDVCLICSLNSAGLGTAMHTQAIWAAVHRPIGQAPRGKPQGGFGTAVEQIKGGRGGGGSRQFPQQEVVAFDQYDRSLARHLDRCW